MYTKRGHMYTSCIPYHAYHIGYIGHTIHPIELTLWTNCEVSVMYLDY